MDFSSLPSDIHLYVLKYCDNMDKMCLKYTNKFYKNIRYVLLAKKGYLNLLKWARINGCSFSKHTCSCAVSYGHLEVLKWLKENGCPWNKSTCSYAVYGRQLEVLKWLRINDCLWTTVAKKITAFGQTLFLIKILYIF
jgi:hypothetical protein